MQCRSMRPRPSSCRLSVGWTGDQKEFGRVTLRRIEFEALDGDVEGIPTTFVVPIVPESAPPALREGLVRRRLAVVEGACPCGARRPRLSRQVRRAAARGAGLAAAWLTVVHASDCPGGDEVLIGLLMTAQHDAPAVFRDDVQRRRLFELLRGLRGLGEGADRLVEEAVNPDGPPATVLEEMAAVVARWCIGRSATCRHAVDRQELVAAAWQPLVAVCLDCAARVLVVPVGVERRRCDRCARLTTGERLGDPLFSMAVTDGVSLGYLLAVCKGCRWWV